MSTKTLERIRTGLRVPYDLNTELIFIARKRGQTKNALILQILWEWINKDEKEIRK